MDLLQNTQNLLNDVTCLCALSMFLVQANTEEELPEYLLGTCRLNHLDAAKSITVKA